MCSMGHPDPGVPRVMQASEIERPRGAQQREWQQVPPPASRVDSFPFGTVVRHYSGTLNLYENRKPAVRGRFVVVSFTALVELMKTSARVSLRF